MDIGMQINFGNNLDKARDCVHWLIENVGPILPHSGGSHVRGLGWSVWVNVDSLNTKFFHAQVELTSDVDDETQLMFMLRWS
jgi:hypothetical protein